MQTILVVDDEAPILESLEILKEMLGIANPHDDGLSGYENHH